MYCLEIVTYIRLLCKFAMLMHLMQNVLITYIGTSLKIVRILLIQMFSNL